MDILRPSSRSSSDSVAQPTRSADPAAKSHRWEIVKTHDGALYVRTTNLRTGVFAALHQGSFTSEQEAHAEIERQKARFEEDARRSRETVLHTEEA